jgi:hypothetical protein
MTHIDLDALTAVLDPEHRGGRRHVDEVAAAIRDLADHLEPSTVPELVLTIIQRGEQESRWSTARATVLRGRTVLPKSILLPRDTPANHTLRPVGVPLRRELDWATTLPLSSSQRELLLAVNAWLRRTNGGKVPVVAAAERAYELLADEKAFDPSPPRGGSTLWRDDRLTFAFLRCERIPTPLTWEPVTSAIGHAGPIVCVENHATFRTLLRVVREQEHPQWLAVAWVQGRNTAPLESLPMLPFSVTRLDYLGDLDAAGLAIAASACAITESIGIPAGPAVRLWEVLVNRKSRAARTPTNEQQADRLVQWLPLSVREKARTLLVSGRVVPQEALRYDFLVETMLTGLADAK